MLGVENRRQETYSFIVRIWHEPREADEGQEIWRGVVDHVDGNQRMYFQELQRLIHFIQIRTGMNLKPKSWWQTGLERIRHGLQAIVRRPMR